MTTLTPLRMQRPSVLLHHHHIHAKQECFDDVLQIDLIVQARQPAPENFQVPSKAENVYAKQKSSETPRNHILAI